MKAIPVITQQIPIDKDRIDKDRIHKILINTNHEETFTVNPGGEFLDKNSGPDHPPPQKSDTKVRPK